LRFQSGLAQNNQETAISIGAEFTERSEISKCIESIEMRRFPDGGFCENQAGMYRPDSTAWAVLALAKNGQNTSFSDSGRTNLAANQLDDGRISMPGTQDVFWATPIAVLAWHGSSQFHQQKDRAIKFLLEAKGKHWPKDANSPAAHDTSIIGWPWVARTHSFVEPTSLALLALDITGQSGHPRFQDGVKMLLDRQLPRGGWNYGNTLVYGQELYPFVDTTGIALAALAGHVEKDQTKNSIAYLRKQVQQCRTPLSLAWALFGLGAWGEFPAEGTMWIAETLKKQDKYGSYRTSLLSILMLAYLCRGDFRKCAA
jgi:hypothetical protein